MIRRRAFSLVELLIVIGIIALLIALLLPSMAKARAQAKAIVCQSNLRTIGQSMLIYANSNRGWLFPPENGLDVPINERWFIYVLRPPAPVDPNSDKLEDWTPKVMLCPADFEPVNFHSYLLNHHLVDHKIVYSSKAPAGITSSRAVVAGEKQTASTNYYVEILGGNSTYFAQTDRYRHGAQLASNYLYLDLHVDNKGPVDTVHGSDPWDFPDQVTTTQP
jgi:prepilin-type N-terminal cleavage/methylation domain-containing protein/prepilin-type processing-associated H-X9-DG protein